MMKFSLREMAAAPILQSRIADPEPVFTASQRHWGYAMAAVGAVLFAMKAIFIKLAYLDENGVSAVTLLFLRMAFATPVYIAIAIYVVRRRKRRGEALPSRSLVLKSMGVGLLGYYISSLLDFQGLHYITAQLERMLLFTYPAFVMILGALFFGKRMSPVGIVCIIVAYSGIALIFVGGEIATGSNVAFGASLVISCAVVFALFQLLAAGLINRTGSTLFTCAAMISAGTAITANFIAVNIAGESLSGAFDIAPKIIFWGAMIAVFSTLLPSFLINIALGRIGAQAVSVLGMISPIATIFAAVILLGEPFGVLDAVGTGLTISGIAAYSYFNRRAAKSGSAS